MSRIVPVTLLVLAALWWPSVYLFRRHPLLYWVHKYVLSYGIAAFLLVSALPELASNPAGAEVRIIAAVIVGLQTKLFFRFDRLEAAVRDLSGGVGRPPRGPGGALKVTRLTSADQATVRAPELVNDATVNVSLLETASARDWDEFVRNCPASSFLHLLGWKRVVERVYGHESRYLVAARAGEIRGVLPLFRIRSALIGSSYASLPGGVCASDEDARRALIDAMAWLTRRDRLAFAVVRGERGARSARSDLVLEQANPPPV